MAVERGRRARQNVSERLGNLAEVMKKAKGALDFVLQGYQSHISETLHRDPRGDFSVIAAVLDTGNTRRIIAPRLMVGEAYNGQVVSRPPVDHEPDKLVYFVRTVERGRDPQEPIQAAVVHAPFNDQDLIRASITSLERALKIETTQREIPVVDRRTEALLTAK